jgi:hypothetical protein
LKASLKANPCPSRIAAVKEDLKASRCPAGRPGKYHGLQPLYTEYNIGHFASSFTL